MGDHDHHNMISNNVASTMDPHAGHDMSNHNHDSYKQVSMDHNGSHSGGPHGMQMYFHASSEATILFSFWTTSSWGGMLGSCIAVLVASALYEGLKVFRERLLFSSQMKRRYKEDLSVTQSMSENNHVQIVTPAEHCSILDMLGLMHFIQTLLHILQIVISYLLMLIFMTYNIWLCISVAVGAGIGYFLFAWKRRRLYFPGVELTSNEHCH